MKGKILSVFVDESGKLQYPDTHSRFYVIGMVFHDQSRSIADASRLMDEGIRQLGFDPERFVFHAGPLIRAEKNFSMMSRSYRGKIFRRMMTFAREAPYRYHCFCVDKKYIDTADQIIGNLRADILAYLNTHRNRLSDLEKVKVYYDCGQSPLTNLLHETFEENITCSVEFAQGVRPEKYKLFQLADLLCTLFLIQSKLDADELMSKSEYSFFGGQRAFKRNVMRYIKPKEI